MKNRNKVATILVSLVMLACTIPQSDITEPNQHIPEKGFVPDKTTAIKIAEAIWFPLYGKSVLDQKPIRATLKDSTVWIVEGTLPVGSKGGVAYIEIQKSDCKILKVAHGK